MNIVLFVADDLGWGDLSANGAEHVQTPNIDRLAAEGRRFVDAHAASAVCTPSRFAILTGRHPWRSPLQSGVLGGNDPSILADVPTLATGLRARGVRTAAFGKWHLGLGWTMQDGTVQKIDRSRPFTSDMQGDGRDIDYTVPFEDGPLDHGFEHFFGIAGSLDMPPYCFLIDRTVAALPTEEKDPLITSQRPGLQSPGWVDEAVDPTFVEHAVRWIGEVPEGERFFAYVASSAPHRPCVPPEFVRGKTGLGDRADSVLLVDWMVGKLFAVLEEKGQLDETLFIFTSDNGAPLIFPEDGDVTTHRPNGPWRGQKADLHEGGHRVPLLVRGPNVDAGSTHLGTVSLLDLMPTLVPDATGSDGVPLPLSADVEDRPDRIVASSAFDGSFTLRRGNMKALYSSGSGGFTEPVGAPVSPSSGEGQLFDMEADPAEGDNLWIGRRAEAEDLWSAFVTTSGYGTQPGAIQNPDGTPN